MGKQQKRTIKLSDQLRHAIETCGTTRYRISKETGISEATLSRFMSGERGLTIQSIDKLGEYLRLSITADAGVASQREGKHGKHHE